MNEKAFSEATVHSTVQYSTIQYNTVQYGTVEYSTESTVQYPLQCGYVW